MTATTTEPAAPTGRTHLRYRPHLDGLRTFAVYLVVAYHAGLGRFAGGFIGVDIFFVLSGFLVTSVLMRDLVAPNGSGAAGIGFRRFYSRRVRRIIPAALTTLLVTAVAFYVIAKPADAYEAMGGFRAACAFVANWFFIHQSTDYFATNVATNPVLHFWSLAVEEQFYLVWPLLLGALFVVSRRAARWRWWAMRIAVAALGVASAVAAIRIGHTNLDRAYYGTDTRAYQLLAGAFLALTPQLFRLGPRARSARRAVAIAALVVLLLLATTAFSMSPITRGVLVAIVASALIIGLESSRGGVANRALSTGPMTYLGRISYGTYLWHWPVIVLLTYDRHISPLPLFVITVVAATSIASLSYRALEQPVRRSRVLDRHKATVIVVGFTASILVGILVMPALLGGANGTLDWKAAFRDIPKEPDCLHAPASNCTVVTGSRGRILLMGDSIARMWIPAFEKIAEDRSLTLSVATRQGCPWQRRITYAGNPLTQSLCRQHRDDWYRRVVGALRPDVIVLAQRGYDDPAAPSKFVLADGHHLDITMPAFEGVLKRASDRSLHDLRAPGRKIVILRPPPSPPEGFSPLVCLSTGKAPSSCGFDATVRLTPLERHFATVAASEADVSVVDLDRLVCPHFPRCDAMVGTTIVWRDVAHITGTYAASLAPRIEAMLHRAAII